MMRAGLVCAFVMMTCLAVPAQAEIKYQHIPAQKKVPQYGATKALDKKRVTSFIQDVHNVVRTGPATMSQDDMMMFFSRHIADGAEFSSDMIYEMPGYPPQYNALSINKTQYINGILGGTGMMENYAQDMQVQDINLGPGKRSAVVKITINEKGKMPWPKDAPREGQEVEMTAIPVIGVSNCEQTLTLSPDNIIQMQGAKCQTKLSFDSFNGTELGPDMFFGR